MYGAKVCLYTRHGQVQIFKKKINQEDVEKDNGQKMGQTKLEDRKDKNNTHLVNWKKKTNSHIYY